MKGVVLIVLYIVVLYAKANAWIKLSLFYVEPSQKSPRYFAMNLFFTSTLAVALRMVGLSPFSL
jgi:hypothetical protein